MKQLNNVLSQVSSFVRGTPLLVLLVGTGLFLTVRLRGLQFRKLGYALKLAFTRNWIWSGT